MPKRITQSTKKKLEVRLSIHDRLYSVAYCTTIQPSSDSNCTKCKFSVQNKLTTHCRKKQMKVVQRYNICEHFQSLPD